MALRGKQPQITERRLKMFIYGGAGIGKTTMAINFPAPYLIDCEKGSLEKQYVDTINAKGGAVFHTLNFNDVITEVKALLSERHEYKTLIIDPVTLIYNELVDQFAISVGTDFGRNVAEANRHFKRLLALILRLDMSVILIAHSKNEYGTGMAVIGQTFDTFKKIDYLFDLVIEAKKVGKKRFGIVKKTRLESFVDGEEFDFNYEVVANKYGRDIIEKDAVPEVFATTEQVEKLKHLIEVLKVPEEAIAKWLKAADADELEDMAQDKIQKCIESLNKKVTGE